MRVASVLLLLVVPATSLHVRARDACSCIDFKSVYTKHGVRCGQGYELGQAGTAKMAPDALPATVITITDNIKEDDRAEFLVYDMFCTKFYMRASFPKCLNKKFGTPSEQWCYVSSECEAASKVEGTDVAIHTCTEGDDLMNNTGPEELDRLAQIDNLEIGLFGKLSYNMEPEKWSEVEGASDLLDEEMASAHTVDYMYGMGWNGSTSATAFLKENHNFEESKYKWTAAKVPTPEAKMKLTRVRRSGIPTIFDSETGQGGGTLILGNLTYAFEPWEGKELGYICMQDNCPDEEAERSDYDALGWKI